MCGQEKSYAPSQKKYYPNRGKYCSMKCLWEYRRKHPHYKRCITRRGYVLIGGQYEHRLFMEKHLGRRLKHNEFVHHVNGNKSDNRLDNLIVLKASLHHKPHNLSERFKTGKFRKCIVCGKEIYVIKSELKRRGKYCSMKCYGKGRRLKLSYKGCWDGAEIRMGKGASFTETNMEG